MTFAIEGLAEYELIAYRQHMVAAARRPATVNRRLDALRRFCRWAQGTGALASEAARMSGRCAQRATGSPPV
jgi:site-specific recombinase XerD